MWTLIGAVRFAAKAGITEIELNEARLKGYNVPDIDYSDDVITQEQSVIALNKFCIKSDTLFYEVMEKVRHFPNGKGEILDTLNQVIDHKESLFWDEEFPNFSDRFLQLSSIEGEGSYFYEKATDHVYDADWGDMEKLVSGELKPTWQTYEEFLEWYYSDEEE